jgi:hypothetical protein
MGREPHVLQSLGGGRGAGLGPRDKNRHWRHRAGSASVEEDVGRRLAAQLRAERPPEAFRLAREAARLGFEEE